MSRSGSDLLWVPLKKTSDIDVSRPVRNLIKSNYASSSDSAPVNVDDKTKELQKLRQGAIKTAERGEAAASAIANYYDQLNSLTQKIPSSDVQVAFKWKDAFDRGGLFGGRISLTVSSLAYEKVAILFNLGAINSIVAADQNVDSEDGMQKALKRLQLAAGIFNTLKAGVVGLIQTDPTPDLEPDTLGVLSDLMLAQAQEMVVNKAISTNMKSAIVAKLCAQCEELFANVMRAMQKENVRNVWDASWLPNVCGKQAIYNGLAQFHQSRLCNEEKLIGEEIARLQYAKTLFAAGLERGGSADLLKVREWQKKNERYLTDAKKDNDFIYHERIPEVKNLSTIGKAAVAKATLPLPEKLGDGKAGDLFEDLCPVAVHQALAAFDVRKTELVNGELARLKEAVNMTNQLLSSMNLPAAIEDTSGVAVPGSVVSKANLVKEAGGMDSLSKLIADLPDLLTRNTEILDECERMLKEEKDSDNQLRAQFKEKWNRTPSNQLTGTFDANAQKYRTIINNAKQADKVVNDKLGIHRKFIEILSRGGDNLQSAIPASGGQAIKGSPTVTKLKALIEDVETAKAECQVIESEVRNAKPDMKPAFFESLNKSGVISESELSAETLERVYGSLRKQATENIAKQEALMKEVATYNEKFVSECGGAGSGANAREEMLKSLAAAHDAFFELKGNLQEGTKFYNDLTQLLVTFQNKVSDFCFARRTEKEELMKDLTSGMANMNLSSAPTPPAHHSATAATAPAGIEEQTRREAPPRPPQPAVNPYAGAPTSTPPTSQPGAAPGAPAAAAAPNPYAGAPPGSAPYPPASAPGGMPQPYFTPMPAGYNPYGGGYGYAAPPPAGYPAYPPAPQYPPAGGYQPYPGYPPQPGYPPYNPGQQQPPPQ